MSVKIQHAPFFVMGAISVVLVASPVGASGLPTRSHPALVPVSQASDVWTGCYVGLHGGYVNAEKKWEGAGSENGPRASSGDGNGFGGLQGGCSYQFQQWVVGVQIEQSLTHVASSVADANVDYVGVTDRSTVTSFGSATARVGYAMGQTLGYVKGGLAWERSKFGQEIGLVRYEASRTDLGYVIGVGLEHKLTSNLSVFAEYDFSRFGARNVTLNRVGGSWTDTARIGSQSHVVKVGLNWWFTQAK